jgi:hypothetical protein
MPIQWADPSGLTLADWAKGYARHWWTSLGNMIGPMPIINSIHTWGRVFREGPVKVISDAGNGFISGYTDVALAKDDVARGESLGLWVETILTFILGGCAIAKFERGTPGPTLLEKLNEPNLVVKRHKGLPLEGERGTVSARLDERGNLRTIRVYADPGDAVDVDFGHDHGLGDPHYHIIRNRIRDDGHGFQQ